VSERAAKWQRKNGNTKRLWLMDYRRPSARSMDSLITTTDTRDQLAPFLPYYGQLGWEVVAADIVRPTDTADGPREFRIFVLMKHQTH
jgi:hypothetical protein